MGFAHNFVPVINTSTCKNENTNTLGCVKACMYHGGEPLTFSEVLKHDNCYLTFLRSKAAGHGLTWRLGRARVTEFKENMYSFKKSVIIVCSHFCKAKLHGMG